jgi:hypothetical protein
VCYDKRTRVFQENHPIFSRKNDVFGLFTRQKQGVQGLQEFKELQEFEEFKEKIQEPQSRNERDGARWARQAFRSKPTPRSLIYSNNKDY